MTSITGVLDVPPVGGAWGLQLPLMSLDPGELQARRIRPFWNPA
jgi:hypothetical protein